MPSRRGVELDRLSLGDWVVAVASVALLVDILALPWYSDRAGFVAASRGLGVATSATATQAYHLLGPLGLLLGLLGLVTWGLTATRAAPALPLSLTVLLALLGLFETIALVIRVGFLPRTVSLPGAPGVDILHTDVGAVLGVFCCAGLVAGAWMSMRTDAIAPGDAPTEWETLRLSQRPG